MSAVADSRDLRQCVRDAQERRLRSRKAINVRANILLQDESLLEGHTVDISMAGVGLFSPKRIPVGEQCMVTFDLAACGETTSIQLLSRVCYCTPHGPNCFRVGMQVVNNDPVTLRFIEALLR